MSSAVLGAGLAAGDRRVDEIEAALFRFRIELAGDLGGCGGVVDEHRALFHAGEGAVGTERHLAQIVVIADAGHDEILSFGCGFRRRRALAAILGDPFLGLGGGAIVDGDLVSALVLEMPGHRITHDTETEERHLRHHSLLLPYERANAYM